VLSRRKLLWCAGATLATALARAGGATAQGGAPLVTVYKDPT
jgi:hypothetical protein